jgi:isopenicillin N synthase-like dioxygenase
MTYQTLRVLDYPSDHADQDLSLPRLDLEPFLSLDAQARRCGPYDLVHWAKARGLAVQGPDNCWIRVVVNREQLDAFVTDMELDVSLAPAPGGQRFVIESEEF